MRDFLEQYRQDVFLAAGIALVAFTAFGLGRATAPLGEKGELRVQELPLEASVRAPEIAGDGDIEEGGGVLPLSGTAGAFVASKNGTRYYLPECSGVNRIKEENRIWFANEEEALAEGYTPAKNCPGLSSSE